MEANDVLPSGIAHDFRYLKPYALYIDQVEVPINGMKAIVTWTILEVTGLCF